MICGDTGGLISLNKIPDLFLSRQVGRKVPHLSVHMLIEACAMKTEAAQCVLKCVEVSVLIYILISA